MERVLTALSQSAPIGVLKGIKPLCVPFTVGSPLSDDVISRRNPKIVSLWDRLGLVFFIEQPQEANIGDTYITVNNFTAQVLFRACCQNHAERLVEKYQPGFVFSNIFSRALKPHERSQIIKNALTVNERFSREVSSVYKLLFSKELDKETNAISYDTICSVLKEIVESAGEKREFTAKHETLFKRVADVLSAAYPSKTITHMLTLAGSASKLTSAQIKYIERQGAALPQRSRADAASRVVELAVEGNSPAKIYEILLKESCVYGILPAAKIGMWHMSYDRGQSVDKDASEHTFGGISKNGYVYAADSLRQVLSELVLPYVEQKESQTIAQEDIVDNTAKKIILDRIKLLPSGVLKERSFLGTARFKALVELRKYFAQESAQGAALSLKMNAENNRFACITASGSNRLLTRFADNHQTLILPADKDSEPLSAEVSNALEVLRLYSAKSNTAFKTNLIDLNEIQSNILENDYSEKPNEVYITDAESTLPKSETIAQKVNVEINHQDLSFAESSVMENSAVQQIQNERILSDSVVTVYLSDLTEREKLVKKNARGEVLPAEKIAAERAAERIMDERVLTEREKLVEKNARGEVFPAEKKAAERAVERIMDEQVLTEREKLVEKNARGEVFPAEKIAAERAAERIMDERVLTEREKLVEKTARGEVLPAEKIAAERAVERIMDERVLTEREKLLEKAAAHSYRSKLDERTLTVLDSIVANAKASKPFTSDFLDTPQLTFAQSAQNQSSQEEQAVISEEIRKLSLVKNSIVSSQSQHIRKLTESVSRTDISRSNFSQTGFPQANITRENFPRAAVKPFVQGHMQQGDMVMLNFSTQFGNASEFSSQQVPLELKRQNQLSEETERSAPKVSTNSRSAALKPIVGRVDSFSREEIKELADKVYERIEQTLKRERRRMGL